MRAILLSAQANDVAAINVFRRAQSWSSDELRELEMELIRSAYLRGGDYRTGRHGYARLLAYDVASNAPLRARLDALVQLGDWDVLFHQGGRAANVYEGTYEFLQRAGLEQSEIDEVFSPAVPVVLPAFFPSPLLTSAASNGAPVDVAFEISQYGDSGRVEVLRVTPNVTRAARERLVQTIQGLKFRPRFVAGELPRASRVVVRYYLIG